MAPLRRLLSLARATARASTHAAPGPAGAPEGVLASLQGQTGSQLLGVCAASERRFQSTGSAAAPGCAGVANPLAASSSSDRLGGHGAEVVGGSAGNAVRGGTDGPSAAPPADGQPLAGCATTPSHQATAAPASLDPWPANQHGADGLASSVQSASPHGLDASSGALDLAPPCPVAYASLEDSLALFFSPPQLGAQLWEGVHSATGLPWWAAIPAGTLAVRAALLPLSLRAYAASSNIALLHSAVGLARRASEAVAASASASGTSASTAASSSSSSSSDSSSSSSDPASTGAGESVSASTVVGGVVEGSSSSGAAAGDSAAAAGGGGGGGAGRAQSLGRVALVRNVLAQLRAARGAPGFGWYLGNAAVQIPLAVALTLALRRMSDSLWPGLTSEGLLYFTDLTAPPVYLQTLSTPYGTAGAILPLAVVLLYVSAVDRSAGASSPGISNALRLLALPLYCAALLQPHAVLLYWTSHAASQLGLYAAAERLPALRRAAGAPDMLLRQAEAEASQGPPLDDVLLGLADSYGKAGNAAAARACLEALLARQPGHQAAAERLQRLPSA